MNAEIKKINNADHLVVTIPVTETVSKSGKSINLATSGGNQPVAINYKGTAQVVKIGVNAYMPNPKYTPPVDQ